LNGRLGWGGYAFAADLARLISSIFQGVTVQAVNGTSREERMRLSDTALMAWPS
jgi:hypothetical protein